MSRMFRACEKLEYISSKKFCATKCDDMSYMFDGCTSLKSSNFTYFLTSNYAKNMSYMFANCSSLKSMKLTHFRINSVINMSYMFFNCSSLEYLDISGFTYNLNNDTNTIS